MFNRISKVRGTALIIAIIVAGATALLSGCQAINVPYDRFDPRDPNRPGIVTDPRGVPGGWSGGIGH